MDPAEYFSQYNNHILRGRNHADILRDLQAEVERIRNDGGADLTGRRARFLQMLGRYQRETLRQLTECQQMADAIRATVDRTPDETDRQLIRLRYIEGKGWQEIADTMAYSLRHTTNLHRRAMKRLAVPE